MKVKALLFSALAFAALTLGFSSCENGENFDSSDIVGSWKQTYLYGLVKVNGQTVKDDGEAIADNETDVMTFNKNGTGIWGDKDFTWSLSGKTLTMNVEGDDETSGKYTVEKLTSSEAIISRIYKYQESGNSVEEYMRMTYKKVK